MEFRDLNYFITICNSKSFTTASELLHVSQPTLTVAIKRLESDLGVQLFVRGERKKGTKLTKAGEKFYIHSLSLLNQIDNIKKDMSSFSGGTVRLGIPQILGAYFFPDIFSKFIIRNPDIQIDINEFDVLDVVEQVANGSLDLGFVTFIDKPSYNGVTFKKIGSDNLCFCTSLSHPLAAYSSINLSETSSEKFILFNKNSNHYSLTKKLFHQHNINPPVLMTSDKIQTIINMVASGIGVSILMKMALEQSNSKVSVIPLEDQAALNIYVCYNSKTHMFHNTKLMLDFILNYTN